MSGSCSNQASTRDDGHQHGHSHEVEGRFWYQNETLVTGLSGILYLLGLLLHFGSGLGEIPVWTGTYLVLSVSDVLFLGALVVGSLYTARNGAEALLSLNMSIDFLISVALLGALVLGKYLEAASLAFLYGVAELLEDYAMRQAETSLEALLELSPQEATVLREGTEQTVDVADIEVGEHVVVRPGEKIAMDGTVVEGESSVDQSPVTGESIPVGKEVGDEVFAGTYNQEGYLEIEVTRRAEDNTLARLIEMVQEAESQQAPSQRFVDTFSSYYTPSVVFLALFVATVMPFMPGVSGSFSDWWLRSMALLVIACPCGLLISTPVTVVSGITSAAGRGVLIKGGEPFEELGNLDVLCFDKTGTLTFGEPIVREVVTMEGCPEPELLRRAATLESRSEHPIGQAIVQKAEERDLRVGGLEDFESVTGGGIRGTVDGRSYQIGKPDLFGVEPPERFYELEKEGLTVVCVGTKDRIDGIIGLADELRPEARGAVQTLRDAGLEVVMITGDNERTARAIAEALEIDHFHADLLPEDKVQEIQTLREDGSVGMVGDGINDAPALAAADVGIAMGAAGSDTALEAADVALMGDELDRIGSVLGLSRTGGNVIRQNIYTAIAVKLLLAVGVIPGWVNLITAVLVGDMGVTFAITANAMRLRSFDW